MGILMSVRFRLPSHLCFAVAVFALCMMAAFPGEAKQKPPEDRPMDFILVHTGDCSESCIQWISAEGEITSDSPKRLKALLKRLKGKKLPVVFQSYGGAVNGALAIGRLIRAAGLETAVGRTTLNDCPMLDRRCTQKIVRNGWSEGEVTSAGSYCYSACPLAFAGGTVRAGAGISLIGLHQVTNGRKSADYGTPGKRNLDAISTRSDVALKRKLSVYFTEMGIKPDEIFAMMGLAAPDGMHFLSNIEAMKSGLITKESNYSNEPGFVFYATDAQPTDAVAN